MYMGCVFPYPSHIVRKKYLKKPTYLPYFPWVGEGKHTIYFLGQLRAYTMSCTPVQILGVTLFTNC